MVFAWLKSTASPGQLPRAHRTREIVLWGPRDSGKSLMLASLQRALETQSHGFGHNFDAVVASAMPEGEWDDPSPPEHDIAAHQASADHAPTDSADQDNTALPSEPTASTAPPRAVGRTLATGTAPASALGDLEARYFTELLTRHSTKEPVPANGGDPAPGNVAHLFETQLLRLVLVPRIGDETLDRFLRRSTRRTGLHPYTYKLRLSIPNGETCCPKAEVTKDVGRWGLQQARLDLKNALSSANAVVICWPLTATVEHSAEQDLHEFCTQIAERHLRGQMLALDTIVFAFSFYEALHAVSGSRAAVKAAERDWALALLASRLTGGFMGAALRILAQAARHSPSKLGVFCTPVSGYGFLNDGGANIDPWASVPHADPLDPRRAPLLPERLRPKIDRKQLTEDRTLLGRVADDRLVLSGRERWRPFHTLDPVLISATGKAGRLTLEAADVLGHLLGS